MVSGGQYTFSLNIAIGNCMGGSGDRILVRIKNPSSTVIFTSPAITASGNYSYSFTGDAAGTGTIEVIYSNSGSGTKACSFAMDDALLTTFTESVSTICGTTKDYRFGFNGTEKDNELYGQGNAYTAEFWEYDPRLGRRWEIDPMTGFYPEQSPYAAFNNNPIYFADPLGLEGESPENKEKGKNPGGSPEKDQKEFDGFKDICNSCGTAKNPVQLPEFNFEDDRLPDMSPPPESGGFAKPKGRTLTNMDKHMAAFHEGFTSPGYFTTNTNIPWNGYSYTKADMEAAKEVYIFALTSAVPIGRFASVIFKGGKILYNGYRFSKLAPITKIVPEGSYYSAAFQMKLPSSLFPGKGYYSHFKAANTYLSNAMAKDIAFSNSIKELGIVIPRSPTGNILGKSPANWVWHHDVGNGVMQLVPKAQHTTGSMFWNTLHPGGVGGMSIWGKL